MVVAFLSLYCTQQLHTTIEQAGIAIAVYGIGAIVGAFIGGKLSDSWGYSKVQAVSLWCAGIVFIVTSFIQNFHIFCVAIFILATINESFRPANTTAVAHNSTAHNRTRSFALIRLAMNLGWSIGTMIGGFVCHINYQLLFWVDGVTSLAAGTTFLLLKFKEAATYNEHTKSSAVTVNHHINPYKNKPFIYFILGTLIYTFCFFQLFSNVPLFYKKGLQLNELVIGIVMSINGIIIALFEMILVKLLEHKYPTKTIIITGTLGMALFFITGSFYEHFAPMLVAFGGILIITFAEMLSLPFMNSYSLSLAHKSKTGKYAAIYTMCWSTGQILAGYIGSIIITHYGFSQLWGLCFMLSIATAILYDKVIKK